MGCASCQNQVTIGMAVAGETYEAMLTIQSLRMLHGDVEVVVVDNAPPQTGESRLKRFCEDARGKYIPFPHPKGTSAPRNEIFKHASRPIVCVIDPHVCIAPGGLQMLTQFLNGDRNTMPLVHGPMLNDSLKSVHATHLKPVWGSDYMFGVWDKDPQADNAAGPPFPIPMHGLGLFACRKDDWLEWPAQLEGFGGEEGMVHQMWKMYGRPTLCLPALRWWHLFRHEGEPTPYRQPQMRDRFRNYMIWTRYLGGDETALVEKFLEPATHLKEADIRQILSTIGPIVPINPHKKPDEPELPPMWKQLWNYSKAKARYMAAGQPNVTEEQHKARLEICENCPTKKFRPSDGRCAACGCFVEEKALYATETCPEKHWPILGTEVPPKPVCQHTNFHTDTQINRNPNFIRSDITIRCTDCGALMKAKGVGMPPHSTVMLHLEAEQVQNG